MLFLDCYSSPVGSNSSRNLLFLTSRSNSSRNSKTRYYSYYFEAFSAAWPIIAVIADLPIIGAITPTSAGSQTSATEGRAFCR